MDFWLSQSTSESRRISTRLPMRITPGIAPRSIMEYTDFALVRSTAATSGTSSKAGVGVSGELMGGAPVVTGYERPRGSDAWSSNAVSGRRLIALAVPTTRTLLRCPEIGHVVKLADQSRL